VKHTRCHGQPFTKLLYSLRLHSRSRHADPLGAPLLVLLSLPLASKDIGV
jgi:hypothetical protein